MPLQGIYLEIISLTALLIVIGIIVDDGIIISENIVRQRENGASPLQAASEGAAAVFKPVLTTILTTFLAFAPMMFMTGVVGEFVGIIPLVISLALFVSLLELVIALPAHIKGGLHRINPKEKRTRSWFQNVERIFNAYIRAVLKWRYVFILLSFLLFGGSIYYVINYMNLLLFPGSAADTFITYVELPVGASIEKMSDKVKEIERLVQDLPDSELQSFSTRIGSHGERYPGESENWAIVQVNLVPYAQRARTAPDIVDQLKAKTDTLSGFREIVYEIERGGPPVGAPITIRVVGSNDELRRSLADSVVTLLEQYDIVSNIDRNDYLGREQVRIVPDYEKLSRLGLSVTDLAQTLRIAYDGQIATTVRYGDEDVKFRVLLDESGRRNSDYLGQLRIPNARGQLIPLGEMADFVTEPGPANYFHYDGERTTRITAETTSDSLTPVQITNSIVKQFDLNEDWPGMRFSIGGEAQETEESFQSLYIAFAIAVVAIYSLLILLFQSVTQPLVVIVAIPFGIVAVIITFAIHGKTLGFLAMMGLVGLSGVTVNDSLVMVDHINNLRRQSKDKLRHLVARGATDRLRAVTVTTLTTAAGLIPLAYGLGGSDPFVAPLALALGYGLLFATPLTLALVPCFYLVREDIISIFKRKKRSS